MVKAGERRLLSPVGKGGRQGHTYRPLFYFQRLEIRGSAAQRRYHDGFARQEQAFAARRLQERHQTPPMEKPTPIPIVYPQVGIALDQPAATRAAVPGVV